MYGLLQKQDKVTRYKNMQTQPWNRILSKMDGKGPPLKRACTRKPVSVQKKQPIGETEDFTSDFFDINKHGYRWIRGALVYKTPAGETLPATGVDSFGPFRDAPKTNFWQTKFPASRGR